MTEAPAITREDEVQFIKDQAKEQELWQRI
jgi:hypothetical protein